MGVFKIPKYLQGHPLIESVECAKDGGADDYKYEIVLKNGYKFSNWRSETMGFFHSVSDFKLAESLGIELINQPIQG